MSDFGKYRRARGAIALFLVLYFFLGLGTLLLPAREIFPFYSWFLFALVPRGATQYELILDEVDGQPLNPTRRFQEAGAFVSSPHSITVYQLTQQIGATNDSYARQLLEQNWLPPHTRYHIVPKKNSPP